MITTRKRYSPSIFTIQFIVNFEFHNVGAGTIIQHVDKSFQNVKSITKLDGFWEFIGKYFLGCIER